MSWVVLDTFAYCKSCCKLQRTTNIELEKQGESENIIIFFIKVIAILMQILRGWEVQ